MEKLNALLDKKDFLAAEEQLKQITDQAMEDGHIDEDEQRQIDEAMRKVDILRPIITPKNQRGKTETKTVDRKGKNDSHNCRKYVLLSPICLCVYLPAFLPVICVTGSEGDCVTGSEGDDYSRIDRHKASQGFIPAAGDQLC
jgi:hypothetical protein